MQLGMVGLGRMGQGLVGRLQAAGHECVVHDVDAAAVDRMAARGATPARTLADLVAALDPPRSIWVMVPAAVTGSTVDELSGRLEAGDTVIDGGNSYYRDDVARATSLAERRIHYLDVGTSGGVWGAERGFCQMVGGETDVVARHAPIFDALAPGVDTAARTPGRDGDPAPEERGWLHCGPSGAGHFVKMVHNGIEYGVMAAYAEGLGILQGADAGNREHDADAETAPLRDPEYYRYDLDLAAVTEVWRRGSVISSWLLDLTAAALAASPDLAEFSGRVSDSGEGRWTAQAAVEIGRPAPVLAAALFGRFTSRGEADYANRVLSAMRKQFGGHDERP